MYKKILGISLLPILLVLPAYAVDVANFDELLTALTTGGNINLTGGISSTGGVNVGANSIVDGNNYMFNVLTYGDLPEKTVSVGSYAFYYQDGEQTQVSFYGNKSASSLAVGNTIYSDAEMTEALGTITMKIGPSSAYRYSIDAGTQKTLTYSAEDSTGKYVAFKDSNDNLIYAYVNKTNPTPNDITSSTKFYSTTSTTATNQLALNGFVSAGEGVYTVNEHETFEIITTAKPHDVYEINGVEYYTSVNGTSALYNDLLLGNKIFSVNNNVVMPATETINVAENIDLTLKNFGSINGFAGTNVSVIAATGEGNINIDNVKFENNNGSIIRATNRNIVVQNSVFDGNSYTYSGQTNAGSAFNISNSNLNITNTTISNNTTIKTYHNGGAIMMEKSNLTLGTDTVFAHNVAKNGGAIYSNNNLNTIDFGNAIFSSNTAGALGGAVYLGNYKTDETINFGNTTFNGNKALQGGAVYIGTNRDVYIGDVVFRNNKAIDSTSALGGALMFSGTYSIKNAKGTGPNDNPFTEELLTENLKTLRINGASFLNNEAVYIDENNDYYGAGGAIGQAMVSKYQYFSNGPLWSTGMTLSVNGTSFAYNKAGAEGGALNSDSELVINKSLFEHNQTLGTTIGTNYADSNEGGGAIFLYDDSIATISNSTFTSNESGTWGGAISIRGISSAQPGSNSSLNVNGSTFTTNTAVYGGAIANSLTNTTEEDEITKYGSVITNTTFVENSATQFGGAVYNVGDMTIKDTRHYRNGGGAFSRNTALKGGAIYNEGSLSIDGATFVGNSATGTGKDTENKEMGGGAIYSDLYTGLTDIKNSVFTGNSTNYIGGAMYVYSGTAEIDNTTFSGNSASWGGAIYTRARPVDGHQISDLTINNSTFNNNTANGVGAIGIMRKGIITNTNFIGNQATDAEDDGAGALFLGAESYTTLTGGKFTSNTSAAAAGALGTRNYINGDDSAAKLDINGTLFENNSATTTGGAIDNYFYNDAANDGYVKVVNATFTSNSAANGGAIYNHTGSGTDKKVNEQYQIGAMSIENSIFTGNTASVGGGAIYNEGDMFLHGTNVFKNNVADGVANDIKNIGTLDIAEGTTTLSGGITGNGALVLEDTGTLNLETASIKQTYFTLDGVVNAELKGADNYASFDITDAFDGTGTLNLTLKGAGDYQVFANQVFDNEHVNVLSSSIYTYNWNNNYDTLSVVAKSVEEIVENTGVEAETIKPVLTMTNSSSESLQELANKILEKVDGSIADKAVATAAVKTIHPETEAVVQSVATSVQTTVGNLAASRMSLTSMGRAGGDIEPTGTGFWANGLYNRSEQDGLFTAYTRGFAIGMDANFNKVLTLGTGYSYSHSNIGATHRGTNIDSYTMFIYGQYKPNAWYANAVLNYTMSDYTEKGSALGVGIVADYDVRAYGARLATGYDLRNGVTPELGLRYTHIDADDYKNNLGIKNSLKSTDYMTLTMGGKYAHGFKTKARHISLLPEVHGLLKYDVVADEQVAVVTMPGVDSYSLSGERLSRFGVELGLGLTMKYYNADWTLDYDFEVREDYTSHTGRIKWRYNF